MKLSELHVLCELVNHQHNISRTAQSLNMAQSGVTRKIQSLENSLGVLLVVRQGKKLVGLTEFGQQVVERGRELLQQVDNVHSLADDYKNNKQGNLSIATTNTQARFFLPQVIVQFKNIFPEVKLHFFQGAPKQLINYLYEATADIAVCTESLKDDQNLEFVECCTWNHAVVVPVNHPLAKKNNLSLADIAQYPILTYDFYLTGGGRIRKAFRLAGLSLQVVFTALDAEVIKTYVRLNQGVGIIAMMARSDADTDLVYKPLNHLIDDSITKLAWLKEKYLNQHVRKFIELAAAQGKVMSSSGHEHSSRDNTGKKVKLNNQITIGKTNKRG